MPQFGAEYFRLSPEMLCVINLRGEFHELNPSWEKTLGWAVTNLRFTSFFTILHPDDVDIFAKEFTKLIEFNEYVSSGLECRARHMDGSYRWLQLSATPVEEEKKYSVLFEILR